MMIKYSKEQIIRILNILKHDLNLKGQSYFKNIDSSNNNYILITCPFHSNHSENHPSCGIVLKKDKSYFHCFTCGKSGSILKFISLVLDIEEEEAKKWLKYNLSIEDRYEDNLLPEINLTKTNLSKNNNLDPKILEQYDYYHDYMWERKLSKEVVDKYRIGYDPIRNAITFPVWDEKGILKFVTARSVTSKRFWIPPNVEKPVYLLNFMLKEKPDVLYVCESQINALTLCSYGYPAVGLFGTGSEHQAKVLAKSGIRLFIFCLDPDIAGTKGVNRLYNLLPKDILLDVIDMPRNGKDINDYTKEEFESFPLLNVSDYLEKYKKELEDSKF